MPGDPRRPYPTGNEHFSIPFESLDSNWNWELNVNLVTHALQMWRISKLPTEITLLAPLAGNSRFEQSNREFPGNATIVTLLRAVLWSRLVPIAFIYWYGGDENMWNNVVLEWLEQFTANRSSATLKWSISANECAKRLSVNRA
jgi:hypothetical protein